MHRWIKRALTKNLTVKGSRGSTKKIEVEPSEKLVYGVAFAIVALVCLTALEVAHILVLGKLNSEILSAMTLLIGTIMGVFFGKKA